MTQQEIFKKIDGILKELNEQSAYLQSGQDFLNDLELELFMANANFLTDHMEILRKLNNQLIKNAERQKAQAYLMEEAQAAPSPMVELVKPAEPVTSVEFDLTKKEEYPLEKNNTTIEQPVARALANEFKPEPPQSIAEAEQPRERFSEPVKNEFANFERTSEPVVEKPVIPAVVISETPSSFINEKPVATPVTPSYFEPLVRPKPEPVPEPQVVETPITVGTQIKIEDKADDQKVITINQLISSQKATQVPPVQKDIQRIEDLKVAITLNDKLLFIRDLFNNYSLAYSEAIDILNRFETFEEADHFLKTNYEVKNHWSSKQATVDKLYSLLRRRFA
jgi:hypothetical protein